MKPNYVPRRAAIAYSILAAVGLSGSAHAQTVVDEVRCVLLSNALASKSTDAHGRQVGASVGSYFMGRLDSRDPAQVKAAIAGQNRKIVAAQAASQMNACAARASRAEARLRALAK
ncbi:hypothetical protein [Sphingomonas sp. TREG-RG-20F-R18-01]|uniref:hypothetical protein n=1 Tax=Sphingomonas sp. TREG-RG-20F-R18-01 TaxID=2914982 RepID=UPI001F5A0FA7|nr:hypothetical protein [Sphingomonas sp. TREG-RG-20F-R18-01]